MFDAFVFYRVSTFGFAYAVRDRCCDATRENRVYGLVGAKWSQWFSIGAAVARSMSRCQKVYAHETRVTRENREGRRIERRAGRKRGKMGRRRSLINGFGAIPACLWKKKCTDSVCITMQNSNCHLIHIVVRSSNAHPLSSPSRFLADTRCVVTFRLSSVVPSAHARRFIARLYFSQFFASFFRMTSLWRATPASHPGAECDTRRSHSSMFGRTMKKKLRTWCHVINRIQLLPIRRR